MSNINSDFTKVLNDFTKVLSEFFPPLYFVTREECERDCILHVKKGKHHPEYIIFHSLDFDKVGNNIPYRQLIPLEEYKGD